MFGVYDKWYQLENVKPYQDQKIGSEKQVLDHVSDKSIHDGKFSNIMIT